MKEISAQLIEAYNSLGELHTWTTIGLLAAAGTIAMAVLQLFKDLTPIRTWYQRRWISRWIDERAHRFNRLGRVDGKAAKRLLVDLATGGDDRAYFELVTEQLVAQTNAAAQAALDYPKNYRDLLIVLSAGADPNDVVRVINGPRGKKVPPAPYLDARNRVGNRIQRNLDGMQISLGSNWRFWMQSTSIALTILVVQVALFASVSAPQAGTIVVAIVVGAIGGYLAPVARDLVAALQSLRKA